MGKQKRDALYIERLSDASEEAMEYDMPLPHFAIDVKHNVIVWNMSCSILTGCRTIEAYGTNKHQQYFANETGLTLADALLQEKSVNQLDEMLKGMVTPYQLRPECWMQKNLTIQFENKPRLVDCLAMIVRDADLNIKHVHQTILATDLHRKRENDFLLTDGYRILAENISDGFLLNQDEHLILVNMAFAKLLGYDNIEDVIGRHITDLIDEKHKESFLKKHYRTLSGENIPQSTWPHVTKDGKIVWLEGHPKRVMWNGKQAIMSTLVDVTISYQREQRMRKEAEQLRLENSMLRSTLKKSYKFQRLIGRSKCMQHVYEMLLRASTDTANVIIYGESGTGKELAAQAIHSLGNRSQGPFVAVNCGAIPCELLESEFFGVKRGAFTGAYVDKPGYIEQASGGTLFLDEVGDLPQNLQVKLLRAIDNGTYSPVGSSETKSADIRIVAATNRDLVSDVASGRFRSDLFYRLHVIPIHLPPLRERKEDIPLLLEHFASKHATGSEHTIFPPEVLQQLYDYDWPGNVREFMNTVQRYMTLKTLDLIHANTQESDIKTAITPLLRQADVPQALGEALKACEQQTIKTALELARGNMSKASRILGISRRNLYRKIQE